MPEIISEEFVRARKRHRCRGCGQWIIEAGEICRRYALKDGADVYSWRNCHVCEWLLDNRGDDIYDTIGSDGEYSEHELIQLHNDIPPYVDTYEALVDRYLAVIKTKMMRRHKKQKEESTS